MENKPFNLAGWQLVVSTQNKFVSSPETYFFRKGNLGFGRKTCAFSFHCFQAKTWAAPKRLFRLVKPTFSVVYKRLFQPEKLTFSPVKRSVSFPKQTPGCIPTVEGVSCSKFTE